MERIVQKLGRSLAFKEFKYCNNFIGHLKNTRNCATLTSNVCLKNASDNKKILSNEKKALYNSTRQLHFSKYLLADKYFTPEHEWVLVDTETGVGTVGITHYAQEQIGDIVYCDLPEVDQEYEKGDAMATIESVKAVSELFAPLSGTITEQNEKVSDNPPIINESPEKEGWLVKIKLSSQSELNELLSEEDYKKLLDEDAD